MDTTQETGSTDTTSPVIIERTDGGQPLYLSRKLGRDFGQPNGAWTADRAAATRMSRDEAVHALSAMPEPEALMSKAVHA